MPQQSKLTRTKSKSKPRKKASNGTESETPSEEAWAKMHPYGSFVVSDSDENPHKFTKGDTAMILPNGYSPEGQWDDWHYWVGHIRDIRADVHDDGSNSVWARVQWYYSGKDVSDVIKSFNSKAVDKYERIHSDHFDLVGPQAFDEIINMIEFDENDPNQCYIPPEQFYSRYTLEKNARVLQPKPGANNCTCKRPYNPTDTNPTALMHFCPRPSCRRAYHHACLLEAKSKEPSAKIPTQANASIQVNTRSARKHAAPPISQKRKAAAIEDRAGSSGVPTTRALRLLASSPDTDGQVDLEALIRKVVISRRAQADSDSEEEDVEPVKKKGRGRPKKPAPASAPRDSRVQQRPTLPDILSSLPSDLLDVAEQPLVRGGAFAHGGISGNIGAVTRARRLVYEVLGGEECPEGWKETVFGSDAEDGVEHSIVKLDGGKKMLPAFICPDCNSAI